MISALQTLLTMRDLLSDPEKWGKGARCHNGQRCLVGAFEYALTGKNLPTGFYQTNEIADKVDALYRQADTLLGLTNQWEASLLNDRSETTHDKILALLNERIEGLAQEGADFNLDLP